MGEVLKLCLLTLLIKLCPGLLVPLSALLILHCCQVQEKLVAAAAAAEAASAQAAAAMAQAEASAAAAQQAQQQLQQVTQEAAARLASQVGCCHCRGRGGHHSDADSASDLPYLNIAERAHSSVISGAVLIGCIFLICDQYSGLYHHVL
jgi:hypothetical protein